VEIPEHAIDRIKRNPRVAYVEEDAKVYALDAELDNSWGVKHIGAGDVHDGGNTGAGVKVAIIDTGIDYNHPDLDANYVGGIDFVNDDNDPIDDAGHGTHCAGIVAAEDDGEGVVGVAPDAELYAVKVLDNTGSGSLSDVIAGIQWSVGNDMQVISMSLGTNFDYQPLHAACDAADDAGMVIVASSGNRGNFWGTGDNVGYPAAYSSVIAVAATDSNDERAYFSSTGPDVELAAPGVSIYSTIIGGAYDIKHGTSMACPHVAGTAALVMADNPGWTNEQVRQQLRNTAVDLGLPGFDYWYGDGLVDAYAASDPAVPGAISGTVTDVETYSAISGATVTDGTRSATTDAEGSYTIADVPAGTYTVTASAAGYEEGSESVTASADETSTTDFALTPVSVQTMHVYSIDMWNTNAGRNHSIYTMVTIHDSEEAPVPEAMVTLETTLPDDSIISDSRSTNSDGTVTFKLRSRQTGTYGSEVIDVVKTGWDYDLSENVETSDSITVP
jgi:subtilisin family serine protease